MARCGRFLVLVLAVALGVGAALATEPRVPQAPKPRTASTPHASAQVPVTQRATPPAAGPRNRSTLPIQGWTSFQFVQPSRVCLLNGFGTLQGLGEWEYVTWGPAVIHVRDRTWRTIYWKLNLATSVVTQVEGGTFGHGGGTETVLPFKLGPLQAPVNTTGALCGPPAGRPR